MNSINVIRHALNTQAFILEPLLDDVKHEPLATPTDDGGNHPLWIVGHIAFSEASFHHMMTGKPHELEHWRELFNGGTKPIADAAIYPSFEEVHKAMHAQRKKTLAMLDKMTDADLDKPCANVPEERKEFFGTYGKALIIMALHPMHHRGQIADVRRSLHRQPIIA